MSDRLPLHVIAPTAQDLLLRARLIHMLREDDIPLTQLHPCPYLPDQTARSQGFMAEQLHPDTYHALMDEGCRRSGEVFYRPRCPDCRKCVPMRIPVALFRPSASQRRVMRRNADVRIDIAEPRITDEKIALYQRYLASQHPGSPQMGDADGLYDFLYKPIVGSAEVMYRDAQGALIGVSIVDLAADATSSVYHYFDPAARRRSPGVFSILREIDLTRQWNRTHLYMGYWIDGAKTMDYKANYRPHEVLIDGEWVLIGGTGVPPVDARESGDGRDGRPTV